MLKSRTRLVVGAQALTMLAFLSIAGCGKFPGLGGMEHGALNQVNPVSVVRRLTRPWIAGEWKLDGVPGGGELAFNFMPTGDLRISGRKPESVAVMSLTAPGVKWALNGNRLVLTVDEKEEVFLLRRERDSFVLTVNEASQEVALRFYRAPRRAWP